MRTLRVAVPPLVCFLLFCATVDGQQRSTTSGTQAPATASREVQAEQGKIVLNEVRSVRPYDFVELYNLTSDTLVFADGWYLIDDGANADRGDAPFSIPKGTRIRPGARLLVVLRSRSDDGGDPAVKIPDGALVAASFRLGATDRIALYRENLLVDEFVWDMDANSLGRYPDGSRLTRDLVPTPGGPNQLETFSSRDRGLVINEIRTRGNDYVEVYNRSDRPLAIETGAWTLQDIRKGLESTVVLPGSAVVPPKGFYVVYTDRPTVPEEGVAPGSVYAAQVFGLGARDALFLRYRGEIVDRVYWSVHQQSGGRYPDGEPDVWASMAETPGKPNRQE